MIAIISREVHLNARDRDLGMVRNITRRDFVNGVSVGAGGAALCRNGPMAQEFAADQGRAG